MDVTPFAGFLVATATGLGLTLATFLVARKSGLAPVQERLVDTLQESVVALNEQVRLQREQLDRETARRVALEEQVRRLRDAVSDLAAENADFRKRLRLPALDPEP